MQVTGVLECIRMAESEPITRVKWGHIPSRASLSGSWTIGWPGDEYAAGVSKGPQL